MYPTHFTFNDPSIIDSINRLEIPPEAVHLIPPSSFVQGTVAVDVYDHRMARTATTSSGGSNTVIVPHQRIVLRPTPRSLYNDIVHYGYKVLSSEGCPEIWTEEACVELQARLLPLVEEPLCLDPSIDVLRQASVNNYNRVKTFYPRKRPSAEDSQEQEEMDSQKQENTRMLLMLDK
eukprot:jgi/Hompol1/1222/HPOL_004695-RA